MPAARRPSALTDRLQGDATARGVRAPRAALSLADFDVLRELGEGSFSRVLLARLKESGEKYALKVMLKAHLLREKKEHYVRLERDAMDRLDHPGVVALAFTFQDATSLYLGLEALSGDLQQQLARRKRKGERLGEAAVRWYAAEVVETLCEVHASQIAHRDLKPENLLFDAAGHLKLTDFGSCKDVAKGRTMPWQPRPGSAEDKEEDHEGAREAYERRSSFVGTPEYMPPELVQIEGEPDARHPYAADWWALGVMLFQMCVGERPFQAATEFLIWQKVAAMEYEFPSDCSVSDDARDLIRRLMDPDPAARAGADEVKGHPFFAGVEWGRGLWDRTDAPQQLEPEPFELAADGDGGAHRSSDGDVDALNVLERAAAAAGGGGGERGGSMWAKHVAPGESVLRAGVVRKYRSRLSIPKRRRLLLTDKPRLLYFEPDSNELKGSVPWSRSSRAEPWGRSGLRVTTAERDFLFEALEDDRDQWVGAIREALENLRG